MTDASGETHQYGKNTGQGGIVDFAGWKEVVIDLDAGHETWGGDRNGRIDYPITAITFTIVLLDTNGHGSCIFPAHAYPHGPITLRICGKDGALQERGLCTCIFAVKQGRRLR